MRRALQSVGMKKFVEFYKYFKNGQREQTIQLLQQSGDVITGARVRWCMARRIFENEWQQEALERVINSNHVDDAIKIKARKLLAKERRKASGSTAQ